MDAWTGKRKFLLLTGIVELVLGVVWTGRGAGLVTGSTMTGKPVWLVIGLLVGLLGLVVTWGALRGSPRF